MARKIYISTSYGVLEILNLRRVWITKYLGFYELLYQDDIYEYNRIYWTDEHHPKFFELKDKLIKAYNNGDTLIEL